MVSDSHITSTRRTGESCFNQTDYGMKYSPPHAGPCYWFIEAAISSPPVGVNLKNALDDVKAYTVD